MRGAVVALVLLSGCAHGREVGAGLMAFGGGTALVGGVITSSECAGHDTEPLDTESIDCEAEVGTEQDHGEGGLALSVSGLIVSVAGLITYLVSGGGED